MSAVDAFTDPTPAIQRGSGSDMRVRRINGFECSVCGDVQPTPEAANNCCQEPDPDQLRSLALMMQRQSAALLAAADEIDTGGGV